MRTRHRARNLRAVAWMISVALTGTLISGCSSDTSIPPPTASAGDHAGRLAAAAAAVGRLQSALRAQDADAAGAVGVGGARAVLAAAAVNTERLGLNDIALRFVDDRAAEAEDLSSYGPDAWRGTVEIRYLIKGWDASETRIETPMVFVPGGDGVQIAAIGGTDGRTPLWLRGPVTATVSGRALVISRDASDERYVKLADRALRDVGRVLPAWRGRLVLEVPGSEAELDEALGATQEQYANIAAVTAAVDGSLVPGSPVHVFLNARVFGGLGPRGSQVVISHESTHVATDATFTSMPTWLLEGFADYVALAHAGIPVAEAASQILSRVRRQGAPDHLPTTEELAPTANGLGATYEEAWLATRFIARSYGEAKLVAFYRAVDGGAQPAQAFQDVLGTSQPAFVTRWSADVDALAGGEAG